MERRKEHLDQIACLRWACAVVWPPADKAEPHLPGGSGPDRGLRSSFVSAMRIHGRPSAEKLKEGSRLYPLLNVNIGALVSGENSEKPTGSHGYLHKLWTTGASFHQTCYYLYIPGSAPNCTLFEVKLGLCLINSDIPEIKHDVYFLPCHVTVCRTVYLTFWCVWASLIPVPHSGKCSLMTLEIRVIL